MTDDSIKNAILKSLEEEKKPYTTRFIKIFILTLLATLFFTLCIYKSWEQEFNTLWLIVCILFGVLMFIAFTLYFRPQPRLSVRGYWAPWVFAKLLLMMTLVTGLQLVICPHFIFGHHHGSNPFAIFHHVTDFYMSVTGSMKGCMFLCGITFSGLSSFLAFWTITRNLTFSRFRHLCVVIGISALSLLPVLFLQLSNDHTRSLLPYWLLGNGLSLFLMAISFKYFGEKYRTGLS